MKGVYKGEMSGESPMEKAVPSMKTATITKGSLSRVNDRVMEYSPSLTARNMKAIGCSDNKTEKVHTISATTTSMSDYGIVIIKKVTALCIILTVTNMTVPGFTT